MLQYIPCKQSIEMYIYCNIQIKLSECNWLSFYMEICIQLGFNTDAYILEGTVFMIIQNKLYCK